MSLSLLRTTLCLSALPRSLPGAVLWVLWVGLLGACGGGEGLNRVTEDTKTYPPVTITGASRVGEARAGVPVQFEGGDCAGGNGQLKAQWTFGEGQAVINPAIKSHTFTKPGYYSLRVRCSDSSDGTAGAKYATSAVSSAYIEVFQ